ncbi:Kelch repeat-containing protein [Streptomyces sp. NPDC058653]|uniref:Kelch repeat-containing protein n=1 Tax=Streptomyces sp. NPDC058653 TaxID=3346576 RepID=UPI0036510F7E
MEAPPEVRGAWTDAGELSVPLVYRHGQYEGPVTLRDGRALAAGGAGRLLLSLDTSSLYNPVGNTWTSTAPLLQDRRMHSLTALCDGRALAAGGIPGPQAFPQPAVDHAELFDPVGEAWTATAPMGETRQGHAATVLADGRVLVTGGQRPRPPRGMGTLATAEVFDPEREVWEPTGAMALPRWHHLTVLLPDGRVLAVGGLTATGQHGASPALGLCELYDPDTGTWSPTGSMRAARATHQAVPLPDGSVLAVGGAHTDRADDARFHPFSLAGTEIYDVAAGQWRDGPSLPWGRGYHRALPLGTGEVVVCGGTENSCLDVGFASTLRWSPGTRHWRPAGPMATGRWAFGATVLLDGRVLAIGGVSRTGAPAPRPGEDVPAARAEVFTP